MQDTSARGKHMTTIALDLEGTIADIHTPFVDVYNKNHGTKHTIKDITHWAFKGGPIKATVDEFFDIVCELWMNYPNKIPPTESYVGLTIEKLQENNVVDILTSSMVFTHYKDYGRDSVLKWLDYHMVRNIPLNNTEGAHKIRFGRDILVDDSPALAETAQKEKRGFVLLYDRPWNQQIKNDDYVQRIFKLSEVLKYAKKF